MNCKCCFFSMITTFLLILTISPITINALEPVELEFFAGPCNSEQAHAWVESTLGIKHVEWLDNTTLKIKAFVSLNCASKVAKGDYEITSDTIILKYIWANPTKYGGEMRAKCMCAQELNYIFKNLEKKDYQFKLESKKDMSYSSETLEKFGNTTQNTTQEKK